MLLALAGAGINSANGQTVVTDPGMMTQQGIEHAESIGEMLTQTEVFLEDLSMKYEEWDRKIEHYEKLAGLGVTAGKKAIVIYREVSNVYTRLEYFRKNLRKNEYLNASEKIILYSEGVSACNVLIENKSDLLNEAEKAAKITGQVSGYENLAKLDELIILVRAVDKKLLRAINHANNIIAAKRNLIARTKAVNEMFGIKY